MSTEIKEFKAVSSSLYSHNPNEFSAGLIAFVISLVIGSMLFSAAFNPEVSRGFFIFLGVAELITLPFCLLNFKKLFSSFRVKSVNVDYGQKTVTVCYAEGLSGFKNHSIPFSRMDFTYGKETDFGSGGNFSPTAMVSGPTFGGSSAPRSYNCLGIKDLSADKTFSIVADQRNWFGRPFLNLVEEMAMIKALGN